MNLMNWILVACHDFACIGIALRFTFVQSPVRRPFQQGTLLRHVGDGWKRTATEIRIAGEFTRSAPYDDEIIQRIPAATSICSTVAATGRVLQHDKQLHFDMELATAEEVGGHLLRPRPNRRRSWASVVRHGPLGSTEDAPPVTPTEDSPPITPTVDTPPTTPTGAAAPGHLRSLLRMIGSPSSMPNADSKDGTPGSMCVPPMHTPHPLCLHMYMVGPAPLRERATAQLNPKFLMPSTAGEVLRWLD